MHLYNKKSIIKNGFVVKMQMKVKSQNTERYVFAWPHGA